MNDTDPSRYRILVYDDNPEFGGHQMMSAYAIEALAEEPAWDVTCAVHPGNTRWRERLQAMQQPVRIIEAPGVTHRFQGLLNRLTPFRTTRRVAWLQQQPPDLILCLQGDIEDSSRMLPAARRAGICCVSYIPIPHRMAEMHAKLGWLRDQLNSYLFQLPDGYITISPSMERLLRDRGTHRPITIVPNAIDTERFRPAPAGPAREALDLPPDIPLAGMVGRIEYKQKGQDIALQAFEQYPQAFGNAHLLFVGDGPDADDLRRRMTRSSRRESLHLISWMKDTPSVYPALTALLLPSHFEGVPLVMLEALACNVPVLGSDRDGMHDWLPEEWLFPEHDLSGLAQAFSRLPENREKLVPELRDKILRTCALSRFGARFREALRPWVLYSRNAI